MKSIKCPLQMNAQSIPDQPAIITTKHTYSWKQLNARVNATVTYLNNRDFQKKNRIGILSTNSVEDIIALLALWRIEAVACLFNTLLPETAIKKQAKQITCQKFITTKNYQNRPAKWVSGINLKQEATIMFTSGSYAEPKAALHTFGNHFYSAKGANAHIPFQQGDRWLLSLPLYHVGGLSILFRSLLGGGSIVIPDTNEDIVQAINKHQITHLSLVPTQLQRLLEKNIDPLEFKAILIGGGPIASSLIQEAREKKIPIHITYGLTEMSSQVATSDNKSNNAKALNYRNVKISKDHEIYVKGETLFKGYISNSAIDLPVDQKGWFPTGDLGKLSGQGTLKITGRKDNLFISGGENIQPEEIEKYLCQIKGIQNAIVVPVENKEFGFRPIAFIQKNKKKLTKKNIIETLQNNLPKFKCPDKFYLWPTNFQTTEIKVNRRYFSKIIKDINFSCQI